MANKKKDEKQNKGQKPEEEIDETAGNPQLTEKELNRLELHDARMNMSVAQINQFKFQEALKKIEMSNELAIIRGHQANAKGSLKAAREDNNAVIKGIEERLGLKMADYTVSDDGTLNYVADDGEQETPES